MRELKNVIRRGRTAGLTPAHYAISDVPAGIFDADVFAHSFLSLCLSVALSLSIRWVGECVVRVVVVVVLANGAESTGGGFRRKAIENPRVYGRPPRGFL